MVRLPHHTPSMQCPEKVWDSRPTPQVSWVSQAPLALESCLVLQEASTPGRHPSIIRSDLGHEKILGIKIWVWVHMRLRLRDPSGSILSYGTGTHSTEVVQPPLHPAGISRGRHTAPDRSPRTDLGSRKMRCRKILLGKEVSRCEVVDSSIFS